MMKHHHLVMFVCILNKQNILRDRFDQLEYDELIHVIVQDFDKQNNDEYIF
jgi:hypothetical protein